MTDRCPSRIKIEAYFLENASSKICGDLRPHIDACEDCRQIGVQLEAERLAFLQKYPFSRFDEAMENRRKPLWKRALEWLPTPRALGASLALAGLAGIMALTLWQKQPTEPTIQVKGGVGLSFFVASKGGDKVEPGKDGMALPSGSDIQFVYSNAEGPYLLLVGVEQDGKMTTYYPDASSDSSSAATIGSRVKLSQGLRWEPRTSFERFYAIFTSKPVTTDEVQKAVSEMTARGKTVEETPKLPLPYSQASILLHRTNGK